MDRITRKELKSDKFALEVGNTVTFFEEHREMVVRYGAIAVGVLVLILGGMWYSRSQHATRQAALTQAVQVQEAPVGNSNPNAPISFPSEEARQQEATKKFAEVASKYSGSDEGLVAQYYLGAIAADQGKLADAEKNFKQVAEKGSANYSALAKLALTQIYFGDGRTAEGEKLARWLMDNPTVFVSKEQATITLARGIAGTKPAEARKLVEPLRTLPGAIGQVAITAYGEIPAR